MLNKLWQTKRASDPAMPQAEEEAIGCKKARQFVTHANKAQNNQSWPAVSPSPFQLPDYVQVEP